VLRRDAIALIGAGAVAWPLDARAQQPAMPVIGFLSSRSSAESESNVTAFRKGLSEHGYFEGKNVTIEYRWADNRYERLPALAADLVAGRVAVIATVGGSVSAVAAKAATTTIPLVFISGADPVKLGLVASLNRPGGNATGVNLVINEIEGKRLGLLHELVPASAVAAYLLNPKSPEADAEWNDVQAAARVIGIQVHVLRAYGEREIDAAFAMIGQLEAGGLLVSADPLFVIL
jgi:putative ABC transport system substrate-binding protein